MKPLFYCLFTLFFFCSFFPANAQQSSIIGKVMDENQQVLSYATLQLLDARDSSVISNVFSDENGRFSFSFVSKGNYLVKALLIGYKDAYSGLISLPSENANVEIPTLTLRTENTVLNEVVVQAPKRPLIERKSDMMVVNVENSTLAAGNTALDILERSPGVSVDKDGNISLLGKQGVTVLIDGKQTYLSSDQLANLLRSTDGNSIKSVELISNPSSKYDASGTAGLINIVLKKNKIAGSSGTLTLGTGYGKGHKANTSVTLNHRSGGVNLYGNYSYMDNASEQVIAINRTMNEGNVNTLFDQNTSMKNSYRNHSYRAGVDYNTSERNVIGFQVNGYTTKRDNGNKSLTLIGSTPLVPDSTLSTLSAFDGRYSSFAANLNNQFTIDSNGHKLTADLDVSRFSNVNDADYNNTFFLPSGEIKENPMLSRSNMPTVINIRIAKVDYTRPFNQQSKLEAGLKYSDVKADNDMIFEKQVAGSWKNDDGRTNHFVYKEQVSAAYLNFNTQVGNWGIQAGLRGEYTLSDGNSVTLNNRVKRDYFDLFPSVFLNYKASENHQLGISYSKRINRPNYGNLNPFAYFLDQYTSEQGNPYLQPEYTHAVELSYTFFQKYHFTTGYNITNDVIAESMSQDMETKSTWVTRDNIAKQRVWFANLNVPVKVAKWWETNTNVNAFYLGFEGNLGNSFLKQGQYAMELRSTQNFNISSTFTAEASFNYQSSLVYSIYTVSNRWALDAGLSKSFFNKNVNLKLSMSDIFDTRAFRVRTNYSDLNVQIYQKPEARVARLTLTYNFGKLKNNNPRNNSSSEEKSRVSVP